SEKEAIRSGYHKSSWHFVNLPLIHPDSEGQFDVTAIRKSILLPELDEKGEPRHALAAIKQSLKTLSSPDSQAADKAVALCWLLHLTGECSQPLHCSALIWDKMKFRPPHGDEGGNLVAIRANESDNDSLVLHAYWDARVFNDEPNGFKTVIAIADKWTRGDA